MDKYNRHAHSAHRKGFQMAVKIKNQCNIVLAMLIVGLVGGQRLLAQFPGAPEPKHYAWSDATLSPDERADMVLKEMTLDEKISLLHGQGMPFGSTGPSESN